MRHYFEAEMRLLSEAAQQFAKAYPEQAGQLNLQTLSDRDPYIERLLEGFAYLTGQIRQRIDDDLPDVSASLLAQLWPHILQPFPAATIMQINPRAGQLAQKYQLPKHTSIQSQAVGDEKTLCRFRTTVPLDIYPWRVMNVTAEEPTSGGTLLQIEIQADAGVALETLALDSLQFYLHADPSIALELYWALAAQLRHVKIRAPKTIELGKQECVQGCHFSPDETLLPLSSRSFYGFHLLHDYFAFREKYLFIRVDNLQQIIFPKGLTQFIVELHTNHIFPSEAKINAQNFKLHCVPAINLYPTTSEPIRFTGERFDYPLIAESARTQSVVFHEVRDVTSVDLANGERERFELMHSFTQRANKKPFYQTQWRELGAELAAPYLVFGDVSTQPKDIVCDVLVSNGHYPRRYLRENMITQLMQTPTYLTATNITRPTSFLSPPKRRDYLWQLLSHLSLNYRSIGQASSLRELLHLLQWTDKQEQQKRIDAIREVEVKTIDKIERGALLRGMQIILTLHEEGFRSPADIYLLGCVLHEFFTQYASINFFVETRIHCHPSKRVLLWKPQPGKKMPI